jgi:hypothetical protein
MSIHEFHAQLTQADPSNKLLAALSQLTLDPTALEDLQTPTHPADPVWFGGLASA